MPPKRKKTPSFPAAPAQTPKKPRLDTHLPSPTPTPTPTPTDEDAAIPERVDSRHLFGGPGSRTRLARDLPPMHSLDDIYASMTSHAMANGLGGFLGHMDRPLRVATVCSGTESPLLALELVQRCLRDRYSQPFDFEHLFSAEIVPFKQAYIERNFKPPLLFRDVAQLKDDVAQTAYGSLREVPRDVDILIAGFSCVDFSALNCKRKKLDENGESGGTFMGIVNYARSYRPRMVVLENVKSCPWDEVAAYWHGLGYLATHVAADTKDFYIPQTRVRGYMFCIDETALAGSGLDGSGSAIMDHWRDTFTSFKRRASSPAGMFLLDNDDRRLEQIESDMALRINATNPRVAADWTRYQNRHRGYREDNKLGDKRPVSKSGDNATCQMPDFAWHVWARASVERIWDTLDINFLRKLQAGYDMNYKERYLDLSQGVEREIDSRPYGIIGCITPCGIPFVTTRGGPLSGRESLSLQGLPIDRLLLTRETQRELQDLAGNAMSSTVVGAAVLSALMTGYKAVRGSASSLSLKENEDTTQIVPMDKYDLVQSDMHLGTVGDINIAQLQAQAAQSARLCTCERQSRVKPNILTCILCGHTACSDCARNPTHSFKLASDLPRSQPVDFVGTLKRILPTRLVFSGISESDYDILKTESTPFDPDTWAAFLRSVMQTIGDELRFSDIKRSEVWTVVYSGRYSVLKLVLGAAASTWLLFAKPPDSEPVSSLNRVILGKPIARMIPAPDSILSGEWEICAPLSAKREMTIHGTGTRVASYEHACGLKTPEHKTSKIWSDLVVDGSEESVKDLDADIRGVYTRLPYCGMANATLHKKPATQDSSAVYLFLDPSKYGSPEGDMFVFSFEHARIPGYERRLSIAQVSHTWRSSEASYQPEPVSVYHRKWIKARSALLQPYASDAHISCRSLKPGICISIGDEGCHRANITILSLSAPSSTIEGLWQEGPWEAADPAHAASLESQISWILQRAAGFADFQDWTEVEHFEPLTESNAPCAVCAPPKPRILWTRGPKGIKGYEHPQDAAVYERLSKLKPSPFLVFRRVDETGVGDLRVTLNMQTLLHRAYDKLVGPRVDNSASFRWRLVPNAYDSKTLLPKFALTGNQTDQQAQPPRFRIELRPEQQRSLFWMMSQEDDVHPFEQEETEEAFLPLTTWRAEGRVTVHKQVRGGVLADEVGYGKTVIVLALIAAKYDVDKPGTPGNDLIPSKATLIIVPEVVISQWRSEIAKFMDIRREDVLVLPDVTTLTKTKVRAIRDARIILVPSSLLSSQSYYQKMNDFTGMPEVPARPGRNFDHWFKDAQGSLRDHVQILMNDGPLDLLGAIHARREEVHTNHTDCTYEPSKRLRGQQYAKAQSRKLTMVDESSTGNEEPVDKATIDRKGKPSGSRTNGKLEFNIAHANPAQDFGDVQIPFLHAFSFARLVMDEFTYADQDRLAPLFALQAYSKWILSGTPPLNDFADVNSITPFFGLHLGVADDELNPGSKRPKHELGVENFQSFKEPHSEAWHLNRHSIAQRFLGRFARRNVAKISEIPFTEHVVLVDQSPAETALYLELHMRLMAQKDQYRRIGKIKHSNDRLQKLKEIINASKTPREALIKRGSCLVLQDGWMDKLETTLDSLIALRRAEVDRLQELFHEKLRLANWIYFHQELRDERYQNFIADVFQNQFGNEVLDADVFQVIKGSLFGSQDTAALDDWTRHSSSRESDNRNIESVEHQQDESGQRDLDTSEDNSESETSSDENDIPKKPETLADFESANRKTVGGMRSVLRKWVRQTGALQFLESVRLVQLSTDIPSCNACESQPDALASISVLGSCGHVLCQGCTSVATHSEECAVDGCIASAKEFEVINGQEIGRWKGAAEPKGQSQCSQYGGSKIDKLVEVIQGTPEEDRVLLFIQFPDLLEMACMALEVAGIKHQRVTASKHALFQQDEKLIAELNQHKVLILNLGTDIAAGLNLQHANHVIFLAPMLCDTQYNYESSMSQAIGRARRYGQSKHVHVYHLLAKRTIDVSIYQGDRILIERDGQGMLVTPGEASADELKGCQGPVSEEYQKE